jgi:hypothetical protein
MERKHRMCDMRGSNDAGFILPLTMLLVLVLTISGTGFLHHDYLERRMAVNNVDNQSAFYLATAGIERAREAFKIPDILTWTDLLNGSDPDYVTDSTPDPLLCPDPTRGCVIPPFGALVDSGIPFDAAFDDGQYEVRAFNDQPGLIDTNQRLTFRALGTVLGEQKLLEVTVQAISGLDLINCQGDADAACPNTIDGGPAIDPMEGRAPSSHPVLPFLSSPLTDPNSDYRNDSFFTFWDSGHGAYPCTAPLPGPLTFDASNPLADNTFYCVDGDVVIQNTGANANVVIFSMGNVDVLEGVTLTNAILVAVGEVRLNGDLDIHAPLPYPAILSEAAVRVDGAAEVFGTIYSTGAIDVNPGSIHGVIIGDPVAIEGGASTLYTDDGNAAYYEFLPGFTYPNELKTTATVNGTWREIQ